MKNIFAKIASFFHKCTTFIKNKLAKPKEFFAQGRTGAIIFLLIFTGIFGADTCFFMNSLLPEFLILPVFWLLVFIVVELIHLCIKSIFKNNIHSALYFIVAAILLIKLSFGGNKFTTKYLLPIAFILSGDIFARVFWSICIKKNFKFIPGYIAGIMGLTFFVLCCMGLFLDTFGKNFIPEYTALKNPDHIKLSDEQAAEFNNFANNGTYTVESVEYNSTEDSVTRKRTMDLSNFASREGIVKFVMDKYFDYDLEHAPIAGKIWYPQNKQNCPVLFIVHGNHYFAEPSYLGYQYLGEYLASNGYVVVSIDQNCTNGLNNENDARAVLILENIREILQANNTQTSVLYNKIDPDKIALAGHSRGGESVATAYLFNQLKKYPDNGTLTFNYNFNISSIIAIAPTVDQYTPAGHAVELQNVNYLLIHGSNDQDVSAIMGEKQYDNITFTADTTNNYFKSLVYIMGANHGQFNSQWGRYDAPGYSKRLLNTAHFISMEDQQKIAKVYIREFLDETLLGQNKFHDMFYDPDKYREVLPQTIYQTCYKTNNFQELLTFDSEPDLYYENNKETIISCSNVDSWYEFKPYNYSGTKENNSLVIEWEEDKTKPQIYIKLNETDFSDKNFVYKIADFRNDSSQEDFGLLEYNVILYDANNRQVTAEKPGDIYPAIAVQLHKLNILENQKNYKHQVKTVRLSNSDFTGDNDFDFKKVCRIYYQFKGGKYGIILLDDIGLD